MKEEIISTEVVEMSPAMARTLLDQNYNLNRKIRQGHVNHFKEIIRYGQWVVGDPIKLATENGSSHFTLTNGQHRLTAIAEGNKTVPLILVRVKTDDIGSSYAMTDMHTLKRSFGESVIAMGYGKGLGVTNLNSCYYGLRQLIAHFKPGIKSGKAVFTKEGPIAKTYARINNRMWMIEKFRKHEAKFQEYFNFVGNLVITSRKYRLANNGAFIGFSVLALRDAPKYGFDFIDGVLTGNSLVEGDARRAIASWREKNPSDFPKLGPMAIFTAWNKFVTETPVAKFRISADPPLLINLWLDEEDKAIWEEED